MEYAVVILAVMAVVSPILVGLFLWSRMKYEMHAQEVANLEAIRNATSLHSQLASCASDLALGEAKKPDPKVALQERLEKPLYAIHQQMDEILVEMRGTRSDIEQFLNAHRKTLRVLLGQNDESEDPDEKAEEEAVARLLRRYPSLSRNEALARVREQAQYEVGRG